MAQQNVLSFTFGIKEIKVLKFLISNIPQVNSFEKDKFQFQIFPASFMDYETKVLGFEIITDIFLDEKRELQVCELIVRMSFNIVNLYDIVPEKEKNTPRIPDNFMQTLMSIALSTSRGILFAKTEGSILSGIYLPILNPAGFKPVGSKIK